jgi:NTE family protein
MLNWNVLRGAAATPQGLVETVHIGSHSANGAIPLLHDASPEFLRPEPPKARIALALGGGAARGWAHIGVLKALDESKIDVSMVAGTSIGALVGGCYLAGKLDELEIFARSLTVRRIAGLLDFAIGGGGLFAGMRLSARMREHLEGLKIEDLDRPFISVATEVNTGHEVWISSGALVTAIRASYALPGIFEPVRCNGRTLVDGALVNPVPVSVCRAYEQPLVVAVNLNYDLYGRSAVIKHNASDPSPDEVAHTHRDMPKGSMADQAKRRLGVTGVMVQAYNIIQDRISRTRLAGDPPDITLQPRLSDIGLADFHRASEAIDRGYEETMLKISELKRLQAVLPR